MTPLEFFDFVSEFIATSELVPNLQNQQLVVNGSVQLTGDSSPQTREEVEALPQDDHYQLFKFDMQGPSGKPRLIVQLQPGFGNLTFTYQHVPNDKLRQKALKLADRWLGELASVGPATGHGSTKLLPSDTTARPGVLIDRYALVRRLGRGYSGEVWRATVSSVPPGIDLSPGQDVALKLYTRLMENSTDTVRVQREFKVATEVDHPNLVKVFDLILSPSRPLHNFLVMELVQGRTLKSLIPREGMPPKRIAKLARQIFGALEALHLRDALHRDVKAANIMVSDHNTDTEAVKLCDLGIVSVAGDPSLTGTSVFMGSKHSAPLEQMTADELSYRSDVYAAGSVMYYCYTGRPMYHKVGPEGAIVARMLQDPERLDPPRDVPVHEEILIEIINHCIEVDPANRPESASEVLELLDKIPGTQ